jgi:hypothetical protein
VKHVLYITPGITPPPASHTFIGGVRKLGVIYKTPSDLFNRCGHTPIKKGRWRSLLEATGKNIKFLCGARINIYIYLYVSYPDLHYI